VPELTQEWILKTLRSLGFKQADAEVYVSLTENGSQEAREIAETLKMYKRQVYRSLKALQAKGIVNASTEHPAQFSAVSFEKVLDAFIKANIEEAKRMEQNRNELLTKWQTLIRESSYLRF
jgi:sugar-specific transcriptional regulator TrmB